MKINEFFIDAPNIKKGSGTQKPNREDTAKTQNAEQIMKAIKASYADLKLVGKAASPFAEKDKKFFSELYRRLDKAEEWSKKFITPNGKGPNNRDAHFLLQSYEKVNKMLLDNEKRKIEDKTLGEIIKSYKDEQNRRVVYEQSLDRRLNAIKIQKERADAEQEKSAKNYLLGNAAEVAFGSEGKELSSSMLSSFFPALGLLTKVGGEFVDMGKVLGGMKNYFKEKKENRLDEEERKLLSEKEKLENKKGGVVDVLETQYKEKEDKDEERHEDLINALENISSGGKISRFLNQSINKKDKKEGGGIIKSIGSKISDFIKAGGSFLMNSIKSIGKVVGSLLKPLGKLLGSAVSAGAGILGDIIGFVFKNPLVGIATALVGLIAYFKDDIMKYIKNAFDKIVDFFSETWDTIKEKFFTAVEFIKELPAKIMEFITGSLGKVGGGIMKAGSWIGGKVSSLFKGKSTDMMDFILNDPDLNKDGKLTKEQAAGIVGNLGHESGGLNSNINEGNPLVKGSKGGFGLAQWTGDRRKALESFAAEKGMDVGSEDLQRQFLKRELLTTHKGTLQALKQTTSPEEAMRTFERGYEGAGIKHYESRGNYTQVALEAYNNKKQGTISSGENYLKSPLETPSIQSIAYDSTNKKLDQVSAALETQRNTKVSPASVNSPSKDRFFEKIKEFRTRDSVTNINLSPDTYLAGMNMGIT